jgi:hypothetical protein
LNGIIIRLITDQDGTKWTVSIYGSKYSVGVDEITIESVMTLSFESDSGETRDRRTGERPLEAISDGELLALLDNGDDDM